MCTSLLPPTHDQLGGAAIFPCEYSICSMYVALLLYNQGEWDEAAHLQMCKPNVSEIPACSELNGPANIKM